MANRTDGVTLRKPKVSFSPNRESDITIEMRTWRSDDKLIRAPLYPHGIEISHRRNSHWFTTEFNSHLQIIYIAEGKLRYRCDNRTFLIGGKRILVIPPGKAFHFETVATGGGGPGYRKTVLFLNGVNLPGITETLALERCTAIDLPETETVERYFKIVYDLFETPEDSHFPALAAAGFELLHYLSGFVGKSNNASPLLFNLIKNQMRGNFDRGGEVNALAAKFKVSDRTIRRMFHAYLDTTPTRYRRECRHRAACELLAMTDLSIKEIADRLGYSSQFHFSREFRRQTGLPPRNWRLERRRTGL